MAKPGTLTTSGAFAFFLLAGLLLTPVASKAHKIIASVFPSGSNIEGEIGFSNGNMAVNTIVEVFDEDGDKLGAVTTDEYGFFVYRPDKAVNLIFRADLGAGHVAETTFNVADMPAIARAETPAVSRSVNVSDPGTGSTNTAATTIGRAQQEIIATIVRDELRPLRREISSYKEKNDLQSVLGGIGYIVGFFGIAFYIAARRQRTKDMPA